MNSLQSGALGCQWVCLEGARQQGVAYEHADWVIVTAAALSQPAVCTVQAEVCTKLLRHHGECLDLREMRALANHKAGNMFLYTQVRPAGLDGAYARKYEKLYHLIMPKATSLAYHKAGSNGVS